MSNIKTWQERMPHGSYAPAGYYMQAEITELRTELATLRTASQQALGALRTIWACTLADEETDAVESAANALSAALESKT